jgi:hypothetical protein
MPLRSRSHRAALLLSLVALPSVPLLAQQPLSIRGSVSDSTGAAIPGATVDLQSSSGTPIAHTVADDHGSFSFTNLNSGDVVLVVPSFAVFASGSLPMHLTKSINGVSLRLKIASVSQEVTVAAEESRTPETSSNKDTVAVTGSELRKLPIFDQDFVATLTPFLDGAAGSSGGVTLIVDGVEMKSVGVSPSAVQEVRINNDPYSAEFTRPGRGRIDIVTKPGSPIFHGEANFIFRDAIFNAKNHFAIVRPPESRRIYEGHLSGPVGRGGHTSFISSVQRREQNTAVVVNAVGPNGPINQNVLTPNRNTQVSLRVTPDFSPSHRLSLGYNYESSSSTNAGVGGLTLP